MLKTIIAEGAGEGEEGMYAIASTMVNRGKFRNKNLSQIVDQPYQYTGRWRKDLDSFVGRQPPEVHAAARRALQRAMAEPMPDIDHYMTTDLYQSPQRPYWGNKLRPTGAIGRHTFFSSRPGKK